MSEPNVPSNSLPPARGSGGEAWRSAAAASQPCGESDPLRAGPAPCRSAASRVLIAEDEPDVREVLVHLLAGFGFAAEATTSGAEALAAAARERPDAVVLDIRMPGMDGLEVCRRLRADPRTATVPILLVTGEDTLRVRLEGFQAGADDYVTKPFEPRELAARLRAHLELAAARCELAALRGVLATTRMISHDFNNPIQAVLGGLTLLQLAREGAAVDEDEAIAMISEATERLTELAHRVVQINEPAFWESPVGPMLDVDASR